MDSSTKLYDVPPVFMESLCRILDSGGERFGWRGLAVRIFPTISEVRLLERSEAVGRSPTRELLWSWAQQNPRVRDLVKVLQDMDHQRAIQLVQDHLQAPSNAEPRLSSNAPHTFDQKTPSPVKEDSIQFEVISSSRDTRSLYPAESVLPVVSYQDVIEGTKDFHQETKISEGNFADIYRAHIRDQAFAVKLFKQTERASWKKLWEFFRKEMEIHHLYKHPNIIDLAGCFSDEIRYCLVYPYFPNGSLYNRLHHLDGERPLAWQDRLAILKGIARALHHLHSAQPCAVICGNLSSTNILLDEHLQPKLSDFGLARLRPHSANHNCTITINTGCHSNRAYLPEEYTRDGKLSLSVDVYSFGMVMMETVTGRKVMEDSPKPTCLREVLLCEVEDSNGVDSCLKFVDAAAGRWVTTVALSLLRLCMECTGRRYNTRPSMEKVVQELSQLLPTPRCPSLEHPRSLDDGLTVGIDRSLSSIPEEHELQRSISGPCECSQSEVTYLSEVMVNEVKEVAEGPVRSWPVQCSCHGETQALSCEDCRANGFSFSHTDTVESER
ncbi:interleukin-1 receptor-associated kinase 3 [Synchiropus picturatus]